jgi:DNA-binding transcriptional MerR regulator
VETIITLREKINDVARSDKHIGFSIFPQNEAIFLQLKTANDDATLIRACVNLRGIIQNLSEDLSNHGLTTEEIKKLLPDTAEENLNKSVNKLFLYLSSRKFTVDNSVFGLKQLNQIVGLIGAHPRDEKDKLIKKLEEAKLDKAYREEEWDILHRSLLEKYINSLNLLLESINKAM